MNLSTRLREGTAQNFNHKMSSKRVAFDEQELESRKKARTEDDGGEEGYDENEEDEDAPEDDLEQGERRVLVDLFSLTRFLLIDRYQQEPSIQNGWVWKSAASYRD
jgi:hypothetical protein